ncbi:MAG: ribonuclease P protein component [Planctomycetes bacterium]|nr:ribonuclease P protein component [Planctomycetota bacterium]
MHAYLQDQRLRKEERLLTKADFDRVFEQGTSAGNKRLIIHWCANDLGHPRVGLVVSKRFGNAVARNKWKRRIRDIFRRNKAAAGGRDIVVLPGKRDEARTATHDELSDAWLALLKRIG